jgi:hypothetical protein
MLSASLPGRGVGVFLVRAVWERARRGCTCCSNPECAWVCVCELMCFIVLRKGGGSGREVGKALPAGAKGAREMKDAGPAWSLSERRHVARGNAHQVERLAPPSVGPPLSGPRRRLVPQSMASAAGPCMRRRLAPIAALTPHRGSIYPRGARRARPVHMGARPDRRGRRARARPRGWLAPLRQYRGHRVPARHPRRARVGVRASRWLAASRTYERAFSSSVTCGVNGDDVSATSVPVHACMLIDVARPQLSAKVCAVARPTRHALMQSHRASPQSRRPRCRPPRPSSPWRSR